MTTATETTVDRVRSVPTAEEAAGRVRQLRSDCRAVEHRHETKIEKAKAAFDAAVQACQAELKPLETELESLGVKLGNYFTLHPHVLPQDKDKELLLTGGLFGAGTGLRLSDRVELDPKAQKALESVHENTPQDDADYLAAAELLTVHFPHLVPLLENANSTEGLLDLAGAVEDLLALFRVKLTLDKRQAAVLLAAQPAVAGPGLRSRKYCRLVVDGDTLGPDRPFGDD